MAPDSPSDASMEAAEGDSTQPSHEKLTRLGIKVVAGDNDAPAEVHFTSKQAVDAIRDSLGT